MTHHPLEGAGLRVRVYFGERDRVHGHALWQSLLELLREEGAAGATVLRAVAGFGANSRIHKISLVDLSVDLPLILEWVDTRERVEALLPRLAERLDGGMITIEPVTIHSYQPHSRQPGEPRS